MPEPNLPPLRVNLTTKQDSQDVISVPLIEETIPELPEDSRRRLIKEFQLRPEIAIQLVNEPILLEYFLALTTEGSRSPIKVANLLLNDLLTSLNKNKVDVEDCQITDKQLKELIDMLLQNEINLEVCREVLDELVEVSDSDLSPSRIVKEKNLTIVSDQTELTKLCMQVLEDNPKLVKQYKDGKVKVFKAFMGILVKNSPKKLDMSLASKIMKDLLTSDNK